MGADFLELFLLGLFSLFFLLGTFDLIFVFKRSEGPREEKGTLRYLLFLNLFVFQIV